MVRTESHIYTSKYTFISMPPQFFPLCGKRPPRFFAHNGRINKRRATVGPLFRTLPIFYNKIWAHSSGPRVCVYKREQIYIYIFFFVALLFLGRRITQMCIYIYMDGTLKRMNLARILKMKRIKNQIRSVAFWNAA